MQYSTFFKPKIKSKSPFSILSILSVHWLKCCTIFTYNGRIVHKLWPQHKISVKLFSASAGAVGTVKAKPLTLIAPGAAAAFCYFSAEGKVKRIIIS